MALSSGTRLGTYEIRALIGAGGMGEVYAAHDTKLDRDVAIKVLPEQFARDSERLGRFQREAKLLASLNHPNIATIHGLEQSGSTHYLVMELVLGDTLRDRIAREGPVPVEEALNIAKQIAEALEAAHGSEKGIIHRDLKPANVKVTPEGRVKVLDFGLAKAFAAEPSTEDIANSPTLSAAPTMQGVIMGTAAYMSPEQARGKTVTKATDIWAFGAVLYELLTGKQAFQGEDVADILATVVKTDPDWSRLPAETPPAIRILLKRCLRKERHQRLQDAASLRIEIEETLAAPAVEQVAGARATRSWRQVAVLGLAILLTAVMAGIAGWNLKPGERPPEVTRVLVRVAPADQLAPTSAPVARPTRTALALSPDGRYLVFSGTKSGKQQLYLRAMDRLEAIPIPGTENTDSPFFSPDGQWVGFWQGVVSAVAPVEGELKKVSLSGGPAVTLCKTPALYGASWGANDIIVFANQDGALWRVAATGGTPQSLTTVDAKKGESSHRLPHVLPGGEAVLFTIQKAPFRWDDAQVVVRSLVTGEQKVLVEGGADARYVPTGHLVYAKGGTLMAMPFDLARLEVTGGSAGIVEGIMQATNASSTVFDTGAAQFSVSTTGVLTYLPGGIFPDPERSLVWVGRDGTAEPLPLPSRRYLGPELSPDGQRLAVWTQGDRNVWVSDISRATMSRLTTDGLNARVIWTPDGKRLTFGSTTTGQENLFWKPADGSGAAERLTTDPNLQAASSWSPDGKTLAFLQRVGLINYDIWLLSFENGVTKARPFLQTPFREVYAEFSPDGRWLAYVSNESGREEVYVQPYPRSGGKQQVSTDGGSQPAWARNGREMFFTVPGSSGTTRMMAVDVTLGATFTVGRPRMLFEGRSGGQALIRGYDVTADGRRFIMVQDKEQPPEPAITEMVLVQNWFEELKRRVPAGKQ